MVVSIDCGNGFVLSFDILMWRKFGKRTQILDGEQLACSGWRAACGMPVRSFVHPLDRIGAGYILHMQLCERVLFNTKIPVDTKKCVEWGLGTGNPITKLVLV